MRCEWATICCNVCVDSMSRRAEIGVVYAAGMIQGVALVTFPAASTVFTSPGGYGLSSMEYGGMFVPQAVMAIVSSMLGAGLRSQGGPKRLYLLGLFANLWAMMLLVAVKMEIPARNGPILRPPTKYSSVVRCLREKW